MALFADSPGPAIGATGIMPTHECSASPYMPQVMPMALPSLFAGAGVPFPAFLPGFMPFAASVPEMFYHWSTLGSNARCLNSFVERPSESSASTGVVPHDAQRSPLGRKRLALYQGDSTSRSSLESCSGTGRGNGAAACAASSSGDSSLRGSETALGLDAWPAFQSLSEPPSCGLQLRSVRPADEFAAAHPSIAAAGVSAESPLLRSCATHGPHEGAARAHGDSNLLPAPAGASRDSAAEPPSELGACKASVEERCCRAGGRQTCCGPEAACVPRETEQQGAAAPARRTSEQGGVRMSLPGPSGDVMWVDARRYQAILRRRRQRATRTTCLAVAFPPCNRKPVRHISFRDLAMLRAEASGQRPDAEDTRGGDGRSGGGGEGDADTDGGGSGGGSAAHGTAAIPSPSGATRCSADPRDQQGRAPAGKGEAAAAAAAAAAMVAALAAAGTLRGDLARAALEAELRAVLAEETGVLALSDETAAADDDGDECENAGFSAFNAL